MDSFLIHGGHRLKGTIEISGSKNSALPIMAAALMAEGKTTLKGVPRLVDIDSMTKLLGELGCQVYRHEPTNPGTLVGPALNGPLDIEVQDESQSEARVRHRQDDAGQHLRAGPAAGQARQGGGELARGMRDRRPAGGFARQGAAEAGGGVQD